MDTTDASALKAHITELEQQLQTTKALLRRAESISTSRNKEVSLPVRPSMHNLLLLADSALPLGSFAYSSGLESFLAHHKASATSVLSGASTFRLFQQFLRLSIHTVAYTNVPYVLACFRDPLVLMELDNDLDASTPCTVARRASIAQGRALLSVWEKAFAKGIRSQLVADGLEAATALTIFAADLKMAAVSQEHLPVNGHLAPIWGTAALSLGLNLEEAGYVFLLNHAKAVISAGVRASVMGPYQAQDTLASGMLQDLIKNSLEKVWFLQPEDAGQAVPSMDLWIGRHELLYSRIFNS
ncbi:hypothetical protein H2198_008500 [Neophaeococcomyces mojaviensis]|uniref:Uncharacterized protein n=1 Tax=Neophaeococcomyces mojaviensis TaxID=3383035 RepID=A0ACC2ZX18_9EURO|nr:hypothetical protein H2198_008500 [Knufia sp. JES_112]